MVVKLVVGAFLDLERQSIGLLPSAFGLQALGCRAQTAAGRPGSRVCFMAIAVSRGLDSKDWCALSGSGALRLCFKDWYSASPDAVGSIACQKHRRFTRGGLFTAVFPESSARRPQGPVLLR
jgi:hypothetical protein